MFAACSDMSVYRYWNVYDMVKPVRDSGKTFQDNTIHVRFWMDEKKIFFHIKNLADAPITIDWRKAAFINVDGKKHSLADQYSIFTSKQNDPTPTIIQPGESIDDFIAPVKNVEKLEEWTWYVYPMFNLKDDAAYNNKGQTFGIDMPVEVKGKWKSYSFLFEVTHVVESERKVN